jgi:transposase
LKNRIDRDLQLAMGGSDHRCEWRERAEALADELAQTRAEMAEQGEKLASVVTTLEKLQRHVFGKRSEKIPRVADELKAGTPPDPAVALEKRRENAEEKRRVVVPRQIEHKVPEDRKTCPKCGGHDFSELGPGKATEIFELLPAIIERQIHLQEKLRCKCGEGIVTADPPARVYDKARFGPNLIANVVVAKCADAIPLHRQAKAFQRAGVPMSDSTLGDVFHRAAEITQPLYQRLLELVAGSEIVLADETTVRVQAKGKTRTAWLWDFIARDEQGRDLITYVYSRSRSGETPERVLAGTEGKLLVDGYTGYNKVTLPGGRERAGCLAHLRRKFFDASGAAPDLARKAMDLILDVYRVERMAMDDGQYGTPEHLKRRKDHAEPSMIELKLLLDQEKDKHPPKGPMGEAIHYALAQWNALNLFLTDARLPVDNNISERALRAAALGRKNYLFVGHDAAGENLAGLYALVATCTANGVNPTAYLADVLIRVQTHPASRIDEILPHNWKPPATQPPA